MTVLNSCSKCGGPLPNGGALGGGCPRCMLELGFETTVGSRLRPEQVVAAERPSVIGRYRILRLIGEGGMGAVYEAEQDHPRRTVALKVIKSGMASPELLRRFEQESQALGRLQHPGIAQIYEAGTVDTGFGPQPYFAMELIRGQSPREYAEAKHLNTRDRLQMMVKICDAVHHAHQRGLIHRDLKPGNIVVDETGQPKILDFGVARVTDSDSRATQQTDMGQLIGTLAYMSPEQALADPLDIDTRSDVYSLGVIFYELLAGRLPYIISKKMHEAIQAIREEDPARLSTSNRTFRGDIETIVAKALEKERERRYASAAEMAADIQRCLNDEPIAARPASRRYQIRKFAKRQKALVMGVAAVFVVLVAGIIVATTLFVYYRKAEQEALIDRDRADSSKLAETQALVRETGQRRIAESARSYAEAQALFAQHARSAAEANLYSNDIYGADREWKVSNIENSDRLLAEAPVLLRNWEWNYLARRNHMEDAVMAGHRNSIVALAIDPEGKQLRSVSIDNTVKDWDVSTRMETATSKFDGAGSDSAGVSILGASGRILYSEKVSITDGIRSEIRKFWDLSAGKEVFSLPTAIPRYISDQGRAVTEYGPVALSPNGKRAIAVFFTSRPAAVRYQLRSWSIDTGRELPILGEFPDRINGLSFSPDGSALALTQDASTRILSSTTGQEIVTLNHSHGINTLAFSSDNTTLAAGVQNEGVRAWNIRDGKELWSASSGNVTQIVFSPDSRLIAAALADRTIQILDLATGQECARLTGHTADIQTLSFTPDGTQLVSAGNDRLIRFWNLNTLLPRRILNLAQPAARIGVSPDGKTLVTLARSGLRLWDLNTGFLRGEFRFIVDSTDILSNSTGNRVMMLNITSISDDHELKAKNDHKILETRTGLEIAQIHLSKEQSRSSRADDSPTNPVGNRNGRVSMYPASPVRINGSDLYIWNQATGKLVSSFRIETKLVPSIQTSSDHELAAIPVGKEFSKLRPRVEIYDTTTGRRLQVLEMSQPLSGVPMAFSSDGNQLAVITGDRNITIWDPSTGTKLFSFPAAGNTGTSVKGISFSPDGRRLVSVSSDSDVWLWDAKSGKSLISLRNSSGSYWVRDATVSTDDYRPLSDAIDVTDETAEKGAKQLSIAFSSDGRFITLTTVMPDPKGAKIRIETWDGSPRQKR